MVSKQSYLNVANGNFDGCKGVVDADLDRDVFCFDVVDADLTDMWFAHDADLLFFLSWTLLLRLKVVALVS